MSVDEPARVGDDDHQVAAPRPGTVHPHLARERALKLLFQADVRGTDARYELDRVATTRGALELLDELEPDEEQVAADDDLRRELTRRSRIPLDDYTRSLVAGVATHLPAIDRVLEDVAEHWRVARMPVVDRNLLRLAVYELAVEDTPPAVVIDEAVSLARAFAGEKARPFINGVLETVRRRVAAGELELGAEDESSPDTSATDAADVDAPPGDQDAPPDDQETGAADDRDARPDDEATAADGDAWSAALDLLTASDDEHR